VIFPPGQIEALVGGKDVLVYSRCNEKLPISPVRCMPDRGGGWPKTGGRGSRKEG
jgi:hypothetical protein